MDGDVGQTFFRVFDAIEGRPHEFLPSPETCRKRASVALIVAYFPDPTKALDPDVKAAQFDDIRDLQRHVSITSDVPHVLFIRRATRSSDRWSSHIALPGGRREADETDLDAAIRETMEEVSLDISASQAFHGGSIGQRLVTSRLGTVQLLTLCPYLFLMKQTGQVPILTGQVSEVQACHWVPLSHLLDPRNATHEYVDVSGRLVGGERHAHQSAFGILQRLVRLGTGLLSFPGIALRPSVSIYSEPETSVQVATDQAQLQSRRGVVEPVSKSDKSRARTGEKMTLWGLTYAVFLDFLDFFPESAVRDQWHYPTFTTPDLAFILYLLNTPNRHAHARKHHNAVALRDSRRYRMRMDWVGTALAGYYSTMRRGIAITFLARTAFLLWLLRRIIRRRRLMS